MTGSALARYELRGTFHMRVLAALRPLEGVTQGGVVVSSLLRKKQARIIGVFFLLV